MMDELEKSDEGEMNPWELAKCMSAPPSQNSVNGGEDSSVFHRASISSPPFLKAGCKEKGLKAGCKEKGLSNPFQRASNGDKSHSASLQSDCDHVSTSQRSPEIGSSTSFRPANFSCANQVQGHTNSLFQKASSANVHQKINSEAETQETGTSTSHAIKTITQSVFMKANSESVTEVNSTKLPVEHPSSSPKEQISVPGKPKENGGSVHDQDMQEKAVPTVKKAPVFGVRKPPIAKDTLDKEGKPLPKKVPKFSSNFVPKKTLSSVASTQSNVKNNEIASQISKPKSTESKINEFSNEKHSIKDPKLQSSSKIVKPLFSTSKIGKPSKEASSLPDIQTSPHDKAISSLPKQDVMEEKTETEFHKGGSLKVHGKDTASLTADPELTGHSEGSKSKEGKAVDSASAEQKSEIAGTMKEATSPKLDTDKKAASPKEPIANTENAIKKVTAKKKSQSFENVKSMNAVSKTSSCNWEELFNDVISQTQEVDTYTQKEAALLKKPLVMNTKKNVNTFTVKKNSSSVESVKKNKSVISKATNCNWEELFNDVLSQALEGDVDAQPEKTEFLPRVKKVKKSHKLNRSFGRKNRGQNASLKNEEDKENIVPLNSRCLKRPLKKPNCARKRSKPENDVACNLKRHHSSDSETSAILGKDCTTINSPRTVAYKEELVRIIEKSYDNWVQCDSCSKWRKLPSNTDPSILPLKWSCAINENEEQNTCSAPEDDWNKENVYVFNGYIVGSVVWARVTGTDWWPGMVDIDPDFQIHNWLDNSAKNVNYYNVTFFDDPVVRGWVLAKNIMKLRTTDTHERFMAVNQKGPYSKQSLKEAVQQAHKARKMSLGERKKKFAFVSRYHGSIGKKSSNKGNRLFEESRAAENALLDASRKRFKCSQTDAQDFDAADTMKDTHVSESSCKKQNIISKSLETKNLSIEDNSDVDSDSDHDNQSIEENSGKPGQREYCVKDRNDILKQEPREWPLNVKNQSGCTSDECNTRDESVMCDKGGEVVADDEGTIAEDVQFKGKSKQIANDEQVDVNEDLAVKIDKRDTKQGESEHLVKEQKIVPDVECNENETIHNGSDKDKSPIKNTHEMDEEISNRKPHQSCHSVQSEVGNGQDDSESPCESPCESPLLGKDSLSGMTSSDEELYDSINVIIKKLDEDGDENQGPLENLAMMCDGQQKGNEQDRESSTRKQMDKQIQDKESVCKPVQERELSCTLSGIDDKNLGLERGGKGNEEEVAVSRDSQDTEEKSVREKQNKLNIYDQEAGVANSVEEENMAPSKEYENLDTTSKRKGLKLLPLGLDMEPSSVGESEEVFCAHHNNDRKYHLKVSALTSSMLQSSSEFSQEITLQLDQLRNGMIK